MGRIVGYIVALVVGGFLVIATTQSAMYSMFPPYPLRPMPIGSDVVIFTLLLLGIRGIRVENGLCMDFFSLQ